MGYFLVLKSVFCYLKKAEKLKKIIEGYKAPLFDFPGFQRSKNWLPILLFDKAFWVARLSK